MLKTEDRGITFEKVVLPQEDIRIAAISLRNKRDSYLLAANGVLYKRAISGKAGFRFQSD
jgi:hypothetical protein